jgi:hypothetical protein
MSNESPFEAVMTEAQKPNGSIPHAAAASTVLLQETAWNATGSRSLSDHESVTSVAVAARDRVGGSSTSRFLSPRRCRSVLRKLFRTAAGVLGMLILLFVFARWVVIPIAFPVANDAWPNATLTVIRAENEGHAQVQPDVGQAIAQGDTVAVLSNSGLDPSRLARLRADLARRNAERTKHRCDLEIARDLEKLADRELKQYRRTLIAGLKASLQETDARIKELSVKQHQARRVLDMCQRSAAAISRDERDRAIEAEAMARNCLEQAEASRKRIAIEMEAAEQNVFVQRDTPIYLQWYLQVRQSIPQLEAQLAEIDAQLAATEAELRQVEKHADLLAGGTICSPVSGVVWHRNTSWGPVAKGESLLEIAQTQGQFIEALFPESHARSLCPGARAVIVFSGLPPIQGTIRAVRQPSPTDHEWTYAIRLPRRLNQLEVLIDFEQPSADSSLLGRQCQVLVADRSNPLHSLAAKLFCSLRW